MTLPQDQKANGYRASDALRGSENPLFMAVALAQLFTRRRHKLADVTGRAPGAVTGPAQ